MQPAGPEDEGPGPFVFTPSQGPSIEGPAFSRVFKAVTALVVLGTGFWLSLTWLTQRPGAGGGVLASFFAAFAMMVFFWWWILRSRTRLDSQAISQSWFTDKRVLLVELSHIRVMRLRGLEWLVAPRVQTRTLMGKFTVFQAADSVLLDEFERLARELKAYRQR